MEAVEATSQDVTEIAHLARVDRRTVQRWFNKSPMRSAALASHIENTARAYFAKRADREGLKAA